MSTACSPLAACLLALGAVVLPVGIGPASADAVTWESEWSFHLRSRNYAKVGGMLTEQAAAELAVAPKQLFAAARSAAAYLPDGIVRGTTDHLGFSQWFSVIGARLATSGSQDASMARALAAVAGLNCRLAAAMGAGAGLSDAQSVAEHTIVYYEGVPPSDGGETLADALGWIRSVLTIPDVDRGAVLALQAELFTRLSARATGTSLNMAKAQLELGKAMVAPDVPSAKSAVERCLAALKPLVSASPPPLEPSSLANEALDLAVRRKLGVRGEFVTEAKLSADGKVRVAAPIGTGWRTVDLSDDKQLALSRDAPGGVRLYDVSVFSYDVTKPYKSPVNDVVAQGSDLKGLAAQRIEIDAAQFATLTRKRDPKLVSVGRGFAPGYYTEVTGTTSENKPMAYRGWIVKGKLNPRTYTILAIDATGSESTPADLQALVASFEEVKPRK